MTADELLLIVRAEVSQAVAGLSVVGGAAQALGKTVEKTQSRTAKAFKSLQKQMSRAAKIGGAALIGLGVAGVTSAAKFDKGMREVFTLLPGISEDAMGEMEDQVKDLSKEMGVLPSEVIPALYQALSAGVPTDNVFDFLRVGVKTSIGGVSDMETAIDGLTTATNAYGIENLDATRAADIMFTAMRLGKTTIGDISSRMFQAVPIAASLGIKFEEVGAAAAALTLQGVPTRVAMTQLRQAMAEMGKAGSIAFETFEEATGQTFPDFIRSGGTLEEALDAMKKHADDMGVGVGDLFGSLEGGMAAVALTSDTGSRAFRDAMVEMADNAGAAEDAFETMDGGLSRSIDNIKANISVGMIEIGEALMPMVEDFSEAFLDVLPGVIDFLIDAFGRLRGFMENVARGFIIVRDAFVALPGPIKAATVAALGLAAALTLATAHPIVMGLTILLGLLASFGSVGARMDKQAETFKTFLSETDDEVAALTATLREFEDADELNRILGAAGSSIREFSTAIMGGERHTDRFIDSMRRASNEGAITGREWQLLNTIAVQTGDAVRGAKDEVDLLARAERAAVADAHLFRMAGVDLDDSLTGDVIPGMEEFEDALGGVEEGFEDTTVKARGLFNELPEMVEMSLDEVKQLFIDNLTAQESWQEDLAALHRLGFENLAAEFKSAGPEFAGVLHEALTEPMGETLVEMADAVGDHTDTLTTRLEMLARDAGEGLTAPGVLGVFETAGDAYAAALIAGWGSPQLPGINLPGVNSGGTKDGRGYYASGGFSPMGARAIVGESGIEVARAVPGGMVIEPLDSQASRGNGGPTIGEVHIHGSNASATEVARELGWELTRRGI